MTNAATALVPLRAATLADLPHHVARPGYDRASLRVGIAHVGVGNFHRAHEALYVDRCLHLPGQEGWAICGIGLRDSEAACSKADALARQDGLYTLTELAPDGTVDRRVIGALIEYLHAPTDPQAVFRKLADPAIRIVSLTVTEGGYNLDEGTGEFMLTTPEVAADLAGGAPRTVFAFIVEALRRRRETATQPFTVVSCDNLRHNGDTARRAIVSYARAIDTALAEWIDANVTFPNSMVDRIAPRVTPGDLEAINRGSGIDDAVPVTAEAFAQWVIEDRFCAGRPAFEQAGVELRSDVAAFEGIKGRMLNASHMLLSYPALLCGYRLVHEAMADVRLARLLDAFMLNDVMPLLQAPAGVSLDDYRHQVLERFRNPAIGDQLERIAHDGASKIPVFHTKTLQAIVQQHRDVHREAFFLACFQRYFKGVDDLGQPFDVQEPQLGEEDRVLIESGAPDALLATAPFRVLNLQHSAAFASAFRDSAAAIEAKGVSGALGELHLTAIP